jgi:hypothetical protein
MTKKFLVYSKFRDKTSEGLPVVLCCYSIPVDVVVVSICAGLENDLPCAGGQVLNKGTIPSRGHTQSTTKVITMQMKTSSAPYYSLMLFIRYFKSPTSLDEDSGKKPGLHSR